MFPTRTKQFVLALGFGAVNGVVRGFPAGAKTIEGALVLCGGKNGVGQDDLWVIEISGCCMVGSVGNEAGRG